jgi:hypothetical protein
LVADDVTMWVAIVTALVAMRLQEALQGVCQKMVDNTEAVSAKCQLCEANDIFEEMLRHEQESVLEKLIHYYQTFKPEIAWRMMRYRTVMDF